MHAPPPAPAQGHPAAPPGWWRSAAPFAGLAALAGLMALARTLGPGALRHLPACPLHRLTGLYCPGCGATRALYHLLRGELVEACSANVLAVAAPGVVLLAWLARRWPARRGPRPGPQVRGAALLAAALLVLAFGVLRNLPATPFAWLAP